MSEGMIDKYKAQWAEMDPKFKFAIGGLVVVGVILTYVQSQRHDRLVKEQEVTEVARKAAMAAAAPTAPGAPRNDYRMTAVPTSVRNQGLEDLVGELQRTTAEAKASREAAANAATLLQKMHERVSQLEAGKIGSITSPGSVDQAAFGNALPPPVDFSQPGSSSKLPGRTTAAAGTQGSNGAVDFSLPSGPVEKSAPKSRNRMKIWDEKADEVKHPAAEAAYRSIPANSALESVMLTGINARSNNASGGAASGTVVSANNVGSPFVTRVKGNAILPNGWKVGFFDDCFISGTGIAVLSSERANVIANTITCVDKKGAIFEAKIKAYGVDLDGIQGISGRVVTKQGSILAKTALAGVASGLGTALAPTAIPGYNSNQQSGEQGIQFPSVKLIGQSALGTGVADGAKALSKFYLDYAKEMFPVIEVNAGTRITWILQETVELTTTPEK